MTDWIQTKAGLQMAETIIRYLPRITVCLEELAKKEGTFSDLSMLIKNYQSDIKLIQKEENKNG